MIGIICGFVLPNIFIDENMGDSEYKSGVSNYLICESVICGSFCLPCLLLMKSKPVIPPSNSQNNYESPPIKECIGILFKNKSFNLKT